MKTPATFPLVSHIRQGSIPVCAWLALAGAATMAAGIALGAAIALERKTSAGAMERSLQHQGLLLTELVGPLLEEQRTGDARLLLTDHAVRTGLTLCRITNADGAVLATAMTPGETGEGTAPQIVSTSPITVGGETASIELGSALTLPGWASSGGQVASVLLIVIGGIGGIIGGDGVRRGLRPLRAVGDALVAMSKGEQTTAALSVDSRFGPQAAAWNRLLDEREASRQNSLSDRARDSLLSRGEGRGDLGQACDALWQGMVLVDENLRIKYANGAAAVFLRSKKEAMSVAGVGEFITDETIIEAIRAVASGEVRRRTSHEVRRSDEQGGGILRFSVRPVRREDAAAALIIIEDITQQRVAEEARNAFVAQVTHELRAPLTNIRLYVEQAIDEGESDPESVAQALNVINQESRRLERIVGDMLSVAEIEAGSFKLRDGEVRLETLFEEIEADFRAPAEAKKIELEFKLPPKLPAIRGDRDKIVLALHNLVGNAIKYTPDGGKVSVRVEVEDKRLTVDVADTGIGINPEETELIFDKFYRARDKRISNITGTGLGLALAREVVRLHGGDISVRSQVDRGSTFTMTLPTLAKAA